MLAVDNFVQDPFSTQSYNRYSYCINNPLKFVDPDGDFWWVFAGMALGAYFGKSMQTHEWNPIDGTSWKNGWEGAVIGALVVGTLGAGVDILAGTSGAGLLPGKGAISVGWKVVSNGLMTADINMLTTWAQNPRDLNMIAKSGMIGFASGAVGGYIGSQFELNNFSKYANPESTINTQHTSIISKTNQALMRRFIPRGATQMNNITTTFLNTFGRDMLYREKYGKVNILGSLVQSSLFALFHILPGNIEALNELGQGNILGSYLSVAISQVFTNIDRVQIIPYMKNKK